MKRLGVRRAVLFCAAAVLAMTGCAKQKTLLSGEQLRKSYPVVQHEDSGGILDTSSIKLDQILYYMDLVCVVTPVSQDYNGVKHIITFQVDRTLYGDAGGKTITVESVAKKTYMDSIHTDSQYVMCFYSVDSRWSVDNQGVFYISQTGQIVPFTDGNSLNEVLGMTVDEFDQRIDKAKKADPSSFVYLQ